jgi:hypothetical protein
VEWAWVAVESAPEPRRITDGQRNKENELEKRPTERYRKSRMAKNGNGNLKKKKKKHLLYVKSGKESISGHIDPNITIV